MGSQLTVDRLAGVLFAGLALVAQACSGGAVPPGDDSSLPDASRPPDGGGPGDGGEVPPDASSMDAAVVDAGTTVDAGLADAGPPAECSNHHDCVQGEFCHRGSCRAGTFMTYHCGRAGCPPGHWCIEADGTRSVCVADPGFACTNACDCGPGHCCLGGRCTSDDGDPWLGTSGAPSACPVGPDTDPASRLPTFCADEPECLAAARAWELSGRQGTFLASTRSGEVVSSCDTTSCFGTACNCAAGQSCVDTVAPVAFGTSCDLFSGGTCVDNPLAESVFGVAPADLIPCCADGCTAGERCDLGWMRNGNRVAYERVVATCSSSSCVCGDGTCCPDEINTCPGDCLPEVCALDGTCHRLSCGDGQCEPFEDETRCPADCAPGCGDGHCGATETAASCATDCRDECGDGWCSESERTDRGSCPLDCDGRCVDSQLYSRVHRVCGDGQCDRTSTCDYQEPESCSSCPRDCGACDWTRVDLSSTRQIYGDLVDVWVGAPDDIYILSRSGAVHHYDGSGWYASATLAPTSVAVANWGLWASGPGDVYATNRSETQHFDGTAWGSISAPALERLWGASPTEVFGISQRAVHRYDGRGWTELHASTAQLVDVSGSGPSDVYALSRDRLRHFDGRAWTESAPAPGTWLGLEALWVAPTGEVYAVGQDDLQTGIGPPILEPAAFRFDASGWTNLMPRARAPFADVWGTGAGEIYAVTTDGELWRYGRSWSRVAAAPATPFQPAALSGSSATDIYSVGSAGPGRAAIYHYDGSTWADLPVTTPSGGWEDVWGTARGNVYLVGADRVYHWDGTNLSYTTLLEPDGVLGLQSVWGEPTGELFTSGDFTRTGLAFSSDTVVWRFDGTAWDRTLITDPALFGPTIRPLGFWGTGPADVYSSADAGVLHFDGSRWSLVGEPSPAGRAVWGAGPGAVFFVGLAGVDQCLASPCTDPTNYARTDLGSSLAGVWGTGAGDVHTVGAAPPGRGVAFHFDGTAWTETYRGPTRLIAVAGRAPTEVYAVGRGGAILAYDGTTWSTAQADLRRPGVAACPTLRAARNIDGDVVVVGDDSTFIRNAP